jgi:hypothetical protein
LDDPEVRTALQAIVKAASAEDVEGVIDDLFDALDDRVDDAPEARIHLMWNIGLSGTDSAYDGLAKRADSALAAAGTSQLANSVSLKALGLAPASDWSRWLPWLDESEPAWTPQKEWAEIALIRVSGLLPQAEQDELDTALILAPKAVAVARLTDDDIGAPLTTTIQGALQTLPWWSGGPDFLRQEKIHEIVRNLGASIGSGVVSLLTDLRYADLVRGVTNAGLTPIVLTSLSTWGVDLKVEHLRDFATRLSTVGLSGDQSTDVELIAARSRLWIDAGALGENVSEAPYTMTFDEIAGATKVPTDRAQDVICTWFRHARLSTSTAEGIISRLNRGPAMSEAEAVRDWFGALTSSEQRTEFLIAMVGAEGKPLGWMRAAVSSTPRDYAEDVVAHSIASDAMKAARAEERRAAVDALIAISPSSPAGQSVAGELIIWFLERKQKVDFDIALAAIRALGSAHGMGRKIGEAFRKASEGLERKIPASERAQFEQSRIVIGQGYFERPKKKGGLSRLLGR